MKKLVFNNLKNIYKAVLFIITVLHIFITVVSTSMEEHVIKYITTSLAYAHS